MVKFNCLIHKETETIIEYEDWLESTKMKAIEICGTGRKIYWKYNPKEMLFSDDFIIVYDVEFAKEELIQIYRLGGELNDKISKLIDERQYLKFNYNVDL